MKPFDVNQKDLATVLGITSRQVYNLGEKGLPSSKASDGSRFYDLKVAVPWFVEYRKSLSRSSEKLEAEVRERRAKAALAELELEERMGSLVPVEYVEELVGPVLDDIRSKVVNLPGRVAPLFPDPKLAAEIITPATNDCLEALQTLADHLERKSGDPLPDDIPGVQTLRKAGVSTIQELRAMEDLTSIRGIGPKMEKKISRYLRMAA